MALSPEIQDSIKTYLWELASHLETTSRPARTEILRDVESHIYEALAAHTPDPTLDDLSSVLAGMPPPDSYASESAEKPYRSGNRLTWNEVPGALVGAGERFIAWLRQFTWESVVGPILLLISMPLLFKGALVLLFGASYYSASRIVIASDLIPLPFNKIGVGFSIVGILLLLLAFAVLFLAGKTGMRGMIRIRNSGWRLRGFTGNYIAYIVSKTLLFSLMVGIGLSSLLAVAGFLPWAHEFTLIILVTIVTLDYFMIKYKWSRFAKCKVTNS